MCVGRQSFLVNGAVFLAVSAPEPATAGPRGASVTVPGLDGDCDSNRVLKNNTINEFVYWTLQNFRIQTGGGFRISNVFQVANRPSSTRTTSLMWSFGIPRTTDLFIWFMAFDAATGAVTVWYGAIGVFARGGLVGSTGADWKAIAAGALDGLGISTMMLRNTMIQEITF